MIALVAILLQVGPPAPCVAPERLPYGQSAQCTGGWLVQRKAVEVYVSASRVCDARVDEARQIADVRIKSCSASMEILHSATIAIVDAYEAGQVADTERLLEATAPACGWLECPGWWTVGGAVLLTAGLLIWQSDNVAGLIHGR